MFVPQPAQQAVMPVYLLQRHHGGIEYQSDTGEPGRQRDEPEPVPGAGEVIRAETARGAQAAAAPLSVGTPGIQVQTSRDAEPDRVVGVAHLASEVLFVAQPGAAPAGVDQISRAQLLFRLRVTHGHTVVAGLDIDFADRGAAG